MYTGSSLAGELEKMPRALRASELAKILSTSKMTIYRLVEQGAIPHFRVGGLIRFDPHAIADWLRRKMPLKQTAA
jgi:excisionase family DNA binding protein